LLKFTNLHWFVDIKRQKRRRKWNQTWWLA
jgi:hypothetical protein